MSTADADAHDLVAAARDLVRIDDPATAGLWPRAAALLCRQGLERAMDRLFERTAPGLQQATARCKLLCLGELLNDRRLAGRVALSWAALSDACHHRVYELPPTAAELQPALDAAWDLADAV
ncbi:MAG TPA: hypothetical protein VFA70_02890, partial [Dehalococcoidia bacterium]|nr:hypothetical protein [Dehalococcoidia bacterium]